MWVIIILLYHTDVKRTCSELANRWGKLEPGLVVQIIEKMDGLLLEAESHEMNV